MDNPIKKWRKDKRKEDTVKIISEQGEQIGELKFSLNPKKKRDCSFQIMNSDLKYEKVNIELRRGEVLKLLAKGHSRADIAKILKIAFIPKRI